MTSNNSRAVVVNNDYELTQQSSNPVQANLLNGLVVFLSNTPLYAPYGVEKFEWNPTTTAFMQPLRSAPNDLAH